MHAGADAAAAESALRAGGAAWLAAQVPPRIDTPRLWIELASLPRHAAEMRAFINESIGRLPFIGYAQTPKDAAWEERFAAKLAEYRARCDHVVIFNAYERGAGRLVANFDLHTFDFDTPRCEIGYVGHPAWTGQGLVGEGARAVVAAAFGLGFWRVQAQCEVGNARSVHFAEQALGMRREGVLRGYERGVDDQPADFVSLAVLRDAWPVQGAFSGQTGR